MAVINNMILSGGGTVKVTTESFATPMKSIGVDDTYNGTWQSSKKWKCVGIQSIKPNGASGGWWHCNIANANINANGLLSVEIHNSHESRTENLQAIGTIIGILDE